MDDQQGNVIDGMVRAHQWRPARSKTRGAAEARSDAPKSIAGSLLVPADMLPAAFLADGDANGDQQPSVAAQPLRATSATADGARDDATTHPNPFLVPEAATLGPRRRTERRTDWRPSRVSRRLGALIALTLALTGLLAILIQGTASTGGRSATSLATVTVGAELPAAMEGAIGATITTLGVAVKDVTHVARLTHATTPARHVARVPRSRHAHRRAVAPVDSPVRAVSVTAPSGSAAPAYTSPSTASTQAPPAASGQPAVAAHTSPPSGPTTSDPLGGIGSCVSGCSN